MVARLNVENFRALIVKETDDARRRVLLSLLAADEAKLAALLVGELKPEVLEPGGSEGRRSETDRQKQNRPEPGQDWRLDATLANMPHGLCMFDAERRLLLCNSRYAEMY